MLEFFLDIFLCNLSHFFFASRVPPCPSISIHLFFSGTFFMACHWILNDRRDDGCMAHALLPLVSGQTSNLSQHPFLLSLGAALGYFSIAALAETSRSELDHEVISFHHPFSSVSSVTQSYPTAARQASLSITNS